MENQIVKVKVSDLCSFGCFCKVTLNGKEYKGLVHISEIANEFVRNVADYVEKGQEIDVMILSVDEPNAQMKLSIKRALNNPDSSRLN